MPCLPINHHATNKKDYDWGGCKNTNTTRCMKMVTYLEQTALHIAKHWLSFDALNKGIEWKNIKDKTDS